MCIALLFCWTCGLVGWHRPDPLEVEGGLGMPEDQARPINEIKAGGKRLLCPIID